MNAKTNNRRDGSRFLTVAAMIAACYAVLTFLLWEFSSGLVQVRVSEALCVLPLFTPAAVPGLTVGCLLANLFCGNVLDALFGTLATLLAAVCVRFIARLSGKKRVFLAPLPSVVCNAVIIPFVLYFGYGLTAFGGQETTAGVLLAEAVSVALGQAISCFGLGIPLYYLVQKVENKYHFFESKKGKIS